MQFENYIDADLLKKFEFRNYGHALEILHDAFPEEWILLFIPTKKALHSWI